MSLNIVTDWGCDPTGATDSTAAYNAGIAAAKVAYPRGTDILYPPGAYAVSSLNATGYNSVRHIGLGGPGSVVLYGCNQTTAAPILDLTKSSGVRVENIISAAQTLGGGVPSVKPLAAFLLAETTAHGDSNKNRMDCCGSMGQFHSAPLCVIGSTDNQFYSCAFQQGDSGSPTLNISVLPDWYIASLYQTITTSSSNVGDNSFFGCEFHGYKGANSGWTIYGRGVDNLRFFGGNCDSSGNAHLLIQGSNNRKVCFFGVKFYSESGHAADHLYRLDSNVDGFIQHGCNDNYDNAYSGTRFTGSGTTTNLSILG